MPRFKCNYQLPQNQRKLIISTVISNSLKSLSFEFHRSVPGPVLSQRSSPKICLIVNQLQRPINNYSICSIRIPCPNKHPWVNFDLKNSYFLTNLSGRNQVTNDLVQIRKFYYRKIVRPKIKNCVFQVTRPCLIFCPRP